MFSIPFNVSFCRGLSRTRDTQGKTTPAARYPYVFYVSSNNANADAKQTLAFAGTIIYQLDHSHGRSPKLQCLLDLFSTDRRAMSTLCFDSDSPPVLPKYFLLLYTRTLDGFKSEQAHDVEKSILVRGERGRRWVAVRQTRSAK